MFCVYIIKYWQARKARYYTGYCRTARAPGRLQEHRSGKTRSLAGRRLEEMRVIRRFQSQAAAMSFEYHVKHGNKKEGISPWSKEQKKSAWDQGEGVQEQ